MGEDWVRLAFDREIPFETMEHRHGIDWEKRPPRMLEDLSPGPLGPIPLQTGRQTSQPQRLDRLRDAHLT